ncbi:MAG TPA: YdiU family protein [Hyphomonadaceae bacterium]|nr:YdiU family protein [Hyphomonadaceae bacterium]HPN04797.1 YdiU family protein [Hyphomonadaceae bacterium]
MTPIYRPEKALLELDGRFHSPVDPADFPRHTIRWRNQRWAEQVGLTALSDAEWIEHFGKFTPLEGSLPKPLAQAYHGHQFQVYNPQIGDGRGFTFAQLRDGRGRLLDFGTKGSGQTPWSRTGDGRLTLKGGVREIMASSMLEALGVNTSKTFSLIETGEQLARHDEPSPTRSSVLVRLSHSHVRFGTFQRQAYAGDADAIGKLVEYCIRHYHPRAAGGDMAASAAGLLREVVSATADLAASWMSAGFVHGVLNTDNMVVTGESFDYGPWRFLPYSDPSFTAAYFDEQGLYAFGRQPSAALWNLSQLASCLTLVAEVPALENELEQFEGLYREAFRKRMLGVLGLKPSDEEQDLALLKSLFAWMNETRASWPQVFFDWFGGPASEGRAAGSPLSKLYAASAFEAVRGALLGHQPERPERLSHTYFKAAEPPNLVIEAVEDLWAHIAERDDWEPFRRHMARIEQAREALNIIG